MARKPNNIRQEIVLTGNAKPQMQRVPSRRWTREKEREFLAVLGETCNVTRASEAVGMSKNGAYKRRRKNAAFRTAWLQTISAAYQQLELVLLERTLNGTEKIIRRHDGSEDRMREYPNGLGLSLLKMHRLTAEEQGAPPEDEDDDELRERLVQKLLRLKARVDQ